ncbi:MAG: EF-hand domain-containing protein [Bacteroidota bacterium]
MKRNKLMYFAILALLMSTSMAYGQSTEQERQNNRRPSLDQLFADLDENEDDKLSKTEIKGPLKRDFDKFDTDEDGYLTREELKKAPKPEGRRPRNRDN